MTVSEHPGVGADEREAATPSAAAPAPRRGGGALESAFTMATAELGFASASRLFLESAASDQDRARLLDALAGPFPVFAAVAAAGPKPLSIGPLAAALERVRRVVVVGLEADHMDALTGLDVEIGWIPAEYPAGDEDRVLRNWGGRVERVRVLADWAGADAALVTFSYGRLGDSLAVRPIWLRVYGPDVRAWFRRLVSWDVIGAPLPRYPRWMVEVPRTDFTHEVG